MFRILIGPDATGGVGAGFTDRAGGVSPEPVGSLNLGRADLDSAENLAANFEALRTAIAVPHLVTVNQVHREDVVVVDQALLDQWGPQSHLGIPAPLIEADALVTALPEVGLAVRVADCVPVLLADPVAGVIGAAHAGREGLRRGVLQSTVARMRELGAEQILAWIGPHICGECYEVGQELADQVAAEQPGIVVTSRWGTPALDLGWGSEQVLTRAGVTPVRVDPCTLTNPDLHSHRRDGDQAGRGVGVIWRVSEPA